MRYRKPDFYDKFSCIAGACPDTCCAGWQISIDEESLEKYHHMKGEFAARLKNSIDWMWECFYQEKGRCSMLNEENLCDLFIHAGERSLCETCSEFPRHVEEFENLREYSLSLACPVTVDLLLQGNAMLPLQEWDTTEAEEFEEFDIDLFQTLESNRNEIFRIMQEHSCTLDERLHRINEQFGEPSSNHSRYKKRLKELHILNHLPLQRNDWCEYIEKAEEILYHKDECQYNEICQRFDSEFNDKWEQTGEALFIYFIYTYYLGAVYDDMPASKVTLAMFSINWIKELAMAKWYKDSSAFSWDDIRQIAWCYARQIEHDDDNLMILEESL